MKCSFCGTIILRGTGKLYAKTDGKILYFCSRRCEKNMLKLGRKGRETRWTEEFRAFKGKEQSEAKEGKGGKEAKKKTQ